MREEIKKERGGIHCGGAKKKEPPKRYAFRGLFYRILSLMQRELSGGFSVTVAPGTSTQCAPTVTFSFTVMGLD
jgi:hypothetical protein